LIRFYISNSAGADYDNSGPLDIFELDSDIQPILVVANIAIATTVLSPLQALNSTIRMPGNRAFRS
jgi:hypothetical protein